MKATNALGFAAVALFLSACVPSVNPYYLDKDVSFDARLIGEWHPTKNGEERESWRFEDNGDKTYKLTVTEQDEKKGVFTATFFKLKNYSFLDLTPQECSFATNQAELVSFCMLPGHLLVNVAQVEPTLKLAFFNLDWLEKHLKANPKALAHRNWGAGEKDRVVLTGSTDQLQGFVLNHMKPGELFDDYGELARSTNSAPAKK